MNKVVFLLEELSMKELLDGLLPGYSRAWSSSASPMRESETSKKVSRANSEHGESPA